MNFDDLNEILFEIDKVGNYPSHKGTPENLRKAIKRLEREGLIHTKGKYTYDMTGKGQSAIDLGGYEEWLNEQENKSNLDDKLKNLTIKQLEGSIFQVKYWWVILILSSIIGFISGNFKLILSWITGE